MWGSITGGGGRRGRGLARTVSPQMKKLARRHQQQQEQQNSQRLGQGEPGPGPGQGRGDWLITDTKTPEGPSAQGTAALEPAEPSEARGGSDLRTKERWQGGPPGVADFLVSNRLCRSLSPWARP